MGKSGTSFKQLKRAVYGACKGTTGNPSCNKRVMSVGNCATCCITGGAGC